MLGNGILTIQSGGSSYTTGQTGQISEGQTLTVTGITDPDGAPKKISYQWYVSNNGGATWQVLGGDRHQLHYSLFRLDLVNNGRVQGRWELSGRQRQERRYRQHKQCNLFRSGSEPGRLGRHHRHRGYWTDPDDRGHGRRRRAGDRDSQFVAGADERNLDDGPVEQFQPVHARLSKIVFIPMLFTQ